VLARIGEPTTNFTSWAEQAGLPANADPDADEDGNGLSSFLEYALGRDPLDPSPVVLPAWNGEAFEFAIDRFRADVEWRVEESNDLASWQPIAVIRSAGLPVSIEPGNSADVPDGIGVVRVAPVALGSAERRFFRLAARPVR
jgi:hypothetical protein